MIHSPEFALPEYEIPPVVETAFAVTLRPLPLTVVDLARFGDSALGHDFPIPSEQPPVNPPLETFNPAIPNLVPTLSLLSGVRPIRLWFQNEDRTRLVQLQRDWLSCNWQSTSDNSAYPRYSAMEALFFQVWESFSEFAKQNSRGEMAVTQCELTYVNHINAGDLWLRHGQMEKVVRLAGNSGTFLPEPEDAQLLYRYRIPYEGKDIGRLYVQALPGLKKDGSPVIQLNLVARGTPIDSGREGIKVFFQLAHDWIVKGFEAVTTDEAQNILWRKIR